MSKLAQRNKAGLKHNTIPSITLISKISAFAELLSRVPICQYTWVQLTLPCLIACSELLPPMISEAVLCDKIDYCTRS